MSDNADWESIHANEIRLWVGEVEAGIWCPSCLLPSAYKVPVSRDPAEPPTSWFIRCPECHPLADQEAV